MRLFLDTDILLDVLLERLPFFTDSAKILNWAEAHPGQCAVSWHGLSNIHYLSKNGAQGFIGELIEFCTIPETGTFDMRRALALGLVDLEDAMQASVALRFGAQMIVTRNLRDYSRSPVKPITPAELIHLL